MRQRKGRAAFIIAFLAPAVLLYGGLVVYPFFRAIQFSAYDWSGLSNSVAFVGAENYKNLLADADFRQTVGNTLKLLFGAGFVTLVLAILISHGMQNQSRLSKSLRAVYLFPQVVSTVVAAVMWQFILNPQGLLNATLKSIGLERYSHTWLGESAWALPSVGVAFVWFIAGFYIMLFSAGLKGISEEVFEAAELDGSQGLHRFRRVTWPLLWSIKRVAIVYLIINVMNIFALVIIMTRGGPDRKSELLLTYLYEQAITNSQFGYATAIAVANFLIIMMLSLIVMVMFRRNPVEGRR